VGWPVARDCAAEGALSRFRDDSDLTHLNRTAGSGTVAHAGEHLYRAISAADRARRVTDGRFDARVLADLERLGDPGAPLPAGPVAAASEAAGLVRRPRERALGLDRPYDLGGIGKGLALRWAWRRLASLRAVASGILLEAGGDRRRHARGSGPPVGIETQARSSASPKRRRALARRAPDGRAVHHSSTLPASRAGTARRDRPAGPTAEV
jgi:thiamine biosynthesis lipoprotein ApbE